MLYQEFGIVPDSLHLTGILFCFCYCFNSYILFPNVHRYGGNFNGTWYMPLGFVLNTELTYSATSGYTAGYDEDSWMWNASISYQFLPGKNATIMLKAYDLLQQKKDISRSVTASYIDDTQYNALTRYFMLSFTYKFNTFGKGNQPESRNERRWGPPGPPPGGGHGRRH